MKKKSKPEGTKYHIRVEVAKVNSSKYKPRTYSVYANSQEEAEKEALEEASGEWWKARLFRRENG